jgi:hypothetical protein
MILTLELPQELEAHLSRVAVEMGMSLSEYVLHLLTIHQSVTSFHVGAELVRFWRDEGVIGSHSEIADSQVYARQLRHTAETRQEGVDDPWLRYAGMWADDPDWDIFQAEVEAFRQAIDARTRANHR